MPRKFTTAAKLRDLNEAEGAVRGTSWDVRIIEAGTSKNGIDYPLQVLHEAAPIFEGLPVIARADEDHVQNKNTDPNKVVGWIRNVEKVPEGLDGTLELLESAEVRLKLVEAWDRGKRDLLGLSMVTVGSARQERSNGATRVVATRIVRGKSVDLVVHPAAGGRLLDLVAAEGASPGGAFMFDKVLALLKARHPEQYKGVKQRLDAGETVAEDELLTTFTEAEDAAQAAATAAGTGGEENDNDNDVAKALTLLTEAIAGMGGSAKPTDDPAQVARQALTEHRTLVRAAEVRLTAADPRVAALVREDMEASELGVFTEAELDESLARYTRAAARVGGFTPRVQHQTTEGGSGAKVTFTEGERRYAALQGMFANEDVEVDGVKVPRYQSIRTAYGDLTGDTMVTGHMSEATNLRNTMQELAGSRLLAESEYGGMRALGDERLMAEAINNTTFADVLADVMHNAMTKAYKEDPNSQWRNISDVVPLSDFRAKYATSIGGYGALATVAESGAYAAVTTPGDIKETYSPLKKGGTETVTREAILNDDVGALRRIPGALASAAAYTLNYYVLTTKLRGAGGAGIAMTDTELTFSAAHVNYATVALAEASLKAARLKMRSAVIAATANDGSGGTTRTLNLSPKYLYVPLDLEDTAYELVAPHNTAMSDAPKENRNWGLVVVVVPHWDDATDWYLFADKSQVGLFEVGFVQGREEPALFVQDMPNVGSMFANDMLTYKIRHEYGCAPVDYRGMTGNVVA